MLCSSLANEYDARDRAAAIEQYLMEDVEAGFVSPDISGLIGEAAAANFQVAAINRAQATTELSEYIRRPAVSADDSREISATIIGYANDGTMVTEFPEFVTSSRHVADAPLHSFFPTLDPNGMRDSLFQLGMISGGSAAAGALGLGAGLASLGRAAVGIGRNYATMNWQAATIASAPELTIGANIVADAMLPGAGLGAAGLVANAARSAKTIFQEFSGGTPALRGTAYSPEIVNARSGAFYSAYGDDPLRGTMTSLEARQWYLAEDSKILGQIDSSMPLESQARQAFDLRNANRTQAREFMSDRITADRLYREEPNMTWNQMMQSRQDRGLSGDDIYRSILQSSQKTRAQVNRAYGLE